jgi:hypothetical protein
MLKVGYEDVGWVYLTQDKAQWCAAVIAVKSLGFSAPWKGLLTVSLSTHIVWLVII